MTTLSINQVAPTTRPADSAVLIARHLSKSFPGVKALHDVSFSLEKGEVLAVIGENGAGKSTLMKILAGVQQPDEGLLFINGRSAHFDSVEAAQAHGIALMHQELNLLGNLDVASNLFLGREQTRLGFLNVRSMQQAAKGFLAQVGLDISPKTLVGTLSIGQQQLIEIARALATNARILIMDEPTSSLSASETERLISIVHQLKSQGVSIIYISHRLSEVKRLADRVLVMRDGKTAGELHREEITHERMVSLMVGRSIQQFYTRTPPAPGPTMLRVNKLATPTFPDQTISFQIACGEVVGIAGLIGAGRTELMRVLFGIDAPLSGSFEVDGKPARFRHPCDAIQAGVMLVPEDRKDQGLLIEESLAFNLTLPSISHLAYGGVFCHRSEQRQLTLDAISALRIRTSTSRKIVKFLSGGNQQKAVIAKWLARNPKLLLLDEPTRGIDIGAKQEIYTLMDKLADEGLAVLFVSSDLEEIINMSDRALVMHEGRLTGELARQDLTEEAIMRLATQTT